MVGDGTNDSQDGITIDQSDNGGIVIEAGPAGNDDRIPTLNPQEIIIPGDTVNDGPKRRGRKPGSKNRASQQSTKEVSQDLSGLLLSLHLMGSVILKTPELAITKEESEQLGEAVARVNREFGVQIMSPKMAALVNLGIVAGTVYGPRVVTVIHEAKKKKDASKGHPVNGATDWVSTAGAVQ